MTRGAASGLNQAGGAAQVAFFIRVKDGDEGNLRKIETFTQEIDAHQHVELAFAQRAEDFDALNRVNFAVEILDANADLTQIIGELLSGALGERGHQHALFGVGALAALIDEVINLAGE